MFQGFQCLVPLLKLALHRGQLKQDAELLVSIAPHQRLRLQQILLRRAQIRWPAFRGALAPLIVARGKPVFNVVAQGVPWRQIVNKEPVFYRRVVQCVPEKEELIKRLVGLTTVEVILGLSQGLDDRWCENALCRVCFRRILRNYFYDLRDCLVICFLLHSLTRWCKQIHNRRLALYRENVPVADRRQY